MEKYLGSQYRFFQAALDGVADPIMVVGVDFHLKLMNQAAREYAGCGERPVAELPPCHQLIFGLDCPCDQVGRPCPLREVVSSGSRVLVEHDHIIVSGKDRSFEILATPLFRENGEMFGIVESLRDVTARKKVALLLRDEQERLERRVRERTAELLQAKEKAELLYRMSPSAIFTVDRDGVITSWNDKAEEITGYPAAEVMGQRCPLFVDQYTGLECCALMADRIGRMSGSECQITIRDGSSRLVRVNTGMLRDADGEVVGVIGSFEDITEEKKRVAETMRAGQLAAIGELAAGVAHEINNPINGIINFAQLLADNSRDEEQRDTLRRIIDEGERVADIVRNLLAFSRQHGDGELEEVVALPTVLDNTLALYAHQLYKDGIILTLDIEENLPLLRLNPQQLQQVFLNLLSNARHALNQRYPGKGPGKKLAIRVLPHRGPDGLFVRIMVTDYGTGIPKEIIGHIFEPFFSSKKQGEGTGLGLSISHGIVKEFKGHLQAESVAGEYTTMIVDLPVAATKEGNDR